MPGLIRVETGNVGFAILGRPWEAMFKHWTVSCRLDNKVMEGGTGSEMHKYYGLDVCPLAHMLAALSMVWQHGKMAELLRGEAQRPRQQKRWGPLEGDQIIGTVPSEGVSVHLLGPRLTHFT